MFDNRHTAAEARVMHADADRVHGQHVDFVVECRDGAVRHAPFGTRQAAEEWAEWGHLCLTGHQVHETPAGADTSFARAS